MPRFCNFLFSLIFHSIHLQLHVLSIECSTILAFFGTVFEPASVLSVTGISVSMLVLLRGSLTLQAKEKHLFGFVRFDGFPSLQTRSSVKRTLRVLLFSTIALAWALPVLLALVFLLKDQYGSDAVYCKKKKKKEG